MQTSHSRPSTSENRCVRCKKGSSANGIHILLISRFYPRSSHLLIIVVVSIPLLLSSSTKDIFKLQLLHIELQMKEKRQKKWNLPSFSISYENPDLCVTVILIAFVRIFFFESLDLGNSGHSQQPLPSPRKKVWGDSLVN